MQAAPCLHAYDVTSPVLVKAVLLGLRLEIIAPLQLLGLHVELHRLCCLLLLHFPNGRYIRCQAGYLTQTRLQHSHRMAQEACITQSLTALYHHNPDQQSGRSLG